jgi:hypothetical protein
MTFLIEPLLRPEYEDEYDDFDTYLHIFLAGGITDCPNWQMVVVKALWDLPIFLYNPRRNNFPIHDPNAALEQITWECHYLNKSDVITFWFAKETLQPIVLFELGKMCMTYKQLLIGIHPEYPRKKDVEIQLSLTSANYSIVYSLEDHINQIQKYIKEKV